MSLSCASPASGRTGPAEHLSKKRSSANDAQEHRLRFTILLTLGIVVAGALTGAPWKPVDVTVLQRWGFALADLWKARWFTLLTGVFLTRNPLMFWGILAFTFASVGVFEWCAGSRRALSLYWQMELIGTLGSGLLIEAVLIFTRSPQAASFPRAAEVGMSAGGFGCLGGLIARLSVRTRWPAFWLVTAYLLVRLFFFTQLSGDTIHLITFPLGFLLESRAARSRR